MSKNRFDQLIAIAETLKDVELGKLARLRAQQAALLSQQEDLNASAKQAALLPVQDATDVKMSERYRDWAGNKVKGIDADLVKLSTDVEQARAASAHRVGQHDVLTKLRKKELLEKKRDAIRKAR
ncbi:hypothetical protein BFP70_09530 [Thioclava sp. SK-1]|uniref:hypothetical protein n=1 Tax=Thioclava sp. SK-1 TaxID=1889770 RepID=UPI000824D609|nr:hypothetical protein [Thioclava sp. SK-1]OCX65300.1 hypothetical protein BFP70_09530 [Thioclava sp. SK-1]